MHLKRKTIPKLWAIPRTGTKYLAVASHNQGSAIPLIVALRDMLKIVKNKKELKGILYEKQIKVNSKIVEEINYPIQLFDTFELIAEKKNYRAILKNKKIQFEEINEKESNVRVYKVLGKKILSGKKIQINLDSGRNLLTNEKINPGEFVTMTYDNKISKIIPLKAGVEVLAIKGKHLGKEGKIENIYKEGENTIATIKTKDKEELKVNIKNLYAKLN